MNLKDNSKMYTEKEISKRFGVSKVTLHKMRKANKIDFIQIGGSIRYPQHVYDGIIKLTK
jgi:hypothetical protein